MPKTLLQKCQGPRASAIDSLVRRGEAKAAEIIKEFGRYALGQILGLGALAKKALADPQDEAAWRNFIHALHDARSSSATAGAPWIEAYSKRLDEELAQRERYDVHLASLVNLHLDAMKIAAAGQSTQSELADLDKKLALAAARLTA
jgi:HPt (histidine-containing phosphotransfer) domain-containing protein